MNNKCFCRYLEAVIPVLASLHPSAIIDSLHFQCTSEVEKQNKLKAAQRKHHRPLSTYDNVDKKEADQKEQRRFGKKQLARESVPEMIKPGNDVDVNPGKSQMSRLQVILSLSKVISQCRSANYIFFFITVIGTLLLLLLLFLFIIIIIIIIII